MLDEFEMAWLDVLLRQMVKNVTADGFRDIVVVSED